MTDVQLTAMFWSSLVVGIHVAFIVRAISRPHREPAARIAWLLVIILLPAIGILTYFLFGETRIGRRRVQRMREAHAELPRAEAAIGTDSPQNQPDIPSIYEHLFRAGQTINGFPAIGGNQARLLKDSNAAIDALVADIEAATHHVHVLFYIWLSDQNGMKVIDALIRASARGVTCRAMADGLGSRALIDSEHWKAMHQAGVRLHAALPIGDPFLGALRGRIDLRNHRKIVVIDDWITYCGSQNCADPEFRVKPKYAPWVDIMVRFQGPIARQNQHLFASDWMSQSGDDLSELLAQPLPPGEPGLTAQVIGTGPTLRYDAMPELFTNLIYAARRDLFITTPYFVPNEAMQTALCATARRGVETTVILPARNDSFIVRAASRSYYADLLAAGVQIFEYDGGLLHAKTLTLDDGISLIGSANMDRRSFELNFENNILIHDRQLTSALRERQHSYLAQSHAVTRESVDSWPLTTRLQNNTIAMLGPLL